MNSYLPFILYAVPFAAAVGILSRAQLEKLRPVRDDVEEPVIAPDEAVSEEYCRVPLRRRYISYTCGPT